MAKRAQLFQALPEELKKVNAALTELNKIMAGANGFDDQSIWSDSAEENITGFMGGLEPDPELKKEIETLLEGLPGTSEVTKALKAAADAVMQVVKKYETQANELGSETSDRFQALKHLLTRHTDDPNYTYTPYLDPFKNYQYGLFPALTDLAKLGGVNIDAEAALGPLKELETFVGAGVAIADFLLYANGTFAFLTRTLEV